MKKEDKLDGYNSSKECSKLESIKKKVQDFENYFRKNRKSYEKDREFLYESTLDSDDRQRLERMGKPVVNVNVVQPYVDRLVGEFTEQAPTISVKSLHANMVSVQQEEIVEGYLRSILSSSESQQVFSEVMGEMLSGGFSAIKVYTDYMDGVTFDQKVMFKKCYSPNLCGFDQLARKKTKSDGEYCYELFPKLKEEVEKEFPGFDLSSQTFSYNSESFSWAFSEQGNFDRKILYVCDFYEKKQREKWIVLISNPANELDPISMLKSEYRDMINSWDLIEAPPVVLKERKMKVDYIVKYKIVGDKILEGPIETDYKFLPIIFFDGNSQNLKDGQVILSYIRNAKDPQKIKNFAMSSMIDSIENMRNSTIMMGESALPSKKEYLDAWADPQKARSALVYKDKDFESNPVAPPQYFSPGEVSPALFQLYNNENKTIQNTLGSYDAQQGVQTGNLSGVAIREGSTQSNSASKPYIINFVKGLSQLCNIITDLMPKYYKTATTIPVIDKRGKESFIVVNDGNSATRLDYESEFLQVDIKPGVNFEMQKQIALREITSMMKISDTFRAMIENEGLPLLIDNLDMRGKDKFILIAEEFMENRKKEQQKASQNPQPSPEMVLAQAEMKKAANQEQEMKMRTQIKDMELQQKNMDLEMSRQKMMIDAINSRNELVIKQQDADTRQQKAQMDSAIKETDQIVGIAKEMVES